MLISNRNKQLHQCSHRHHHHRQCDQRLNRQHRFELNKLRKNKKHLQYRMYHRLRPHDRIIVIINEIKPNIADKKTNKKHRISFKCRVSQDNIKLHRYHLVFNNDSIIQIRIFIHHKRQIRIFLGYFLLYYSFIRSFYFQRVNPNGYPRTRSRSYVPPMPDQHQQHIPRPPPTPSRFQNLTDQFFRPIPPTRFAPQPAPRHNRNFHIPTPLPNKFRRSNRRRDPPQPTTITENHIYPNNIQQQPRVQRTKSENRNFRNNNQHQKSRSTTNHFQQFSPLQSQPTIQRHFVPFRAAPVFLTSIQSTAPLFYPNQRRQYPHVQTQFRLVNHFQLGTNRF